MNKHELIEAELDILREAAAGCYTNDDLLTIYWVFDKLYETYDRKQEEKSRHLREMLGNYTGTITTIEGGEENVQML